MKMLYTSDKAETHYSLTDKGKRLRADIRQMS
jgi:predicted transcriptional regulator